MATLTKIANHQELGTYQQTAVDKMKQSSQIRLISVSPKVVDSMIALKGRGIKALTVPGRYQVSDAAWAKLQQRYSWCTDF